MNARGDVIEISVGLTLIRDSDGHALHFIVLVDDVSSRKLYERQLRHIADHDPLTGLLNRARLDQALDEHVARLRRYPCGGAAHDRHRPFKHVNDRRGHHAGDQLLISIARTLQSRVRETDLLARLGGDEFAVLMAGGGEDEAQALASDLSDLVRQRSVLLDGGIPGGITASIGIAVFDDRQNLSAADMLREADTAMYTANKAGATASLPT